MKVFTVKNILEIANSPKSIKTGIIDGAYDIGFENGNSSDAIALEAAINVVSNVAGAKRGEWYAVAVSTFERVNVAIIGKFIMVEW